MPPNMPMGSTPGGGSPGSPLAGPPVMVLPNLETLMKLSNQTLGQLIAAINTNFQGTAAIKSALGISSTGGATISINSAGNTVGGYLMAIAVTKASTGLFGYVYDANSPANMSSSNIMTVISSAVSNTNYAYPYFKGLTVQTSTSAGQNAVSVFYI